MTYVPIIITQTEAHRDYVCTVINSTTSYCTYVEEPINWFVVGVAIAFIVCFLAVCFWLMEQG
jgi:hypothetical protein